MENQKLIIECKERLGQSLPSGDELEVEKVNRFVKRVLETYMYKRHPRVLKDSLLLDTAVMLSLVACSRRVKVESIKGGPGVYPNLYVIKIMPSASGKDLPLALAQDELLDAVKLDLESDYREFLEDFEEHPYNYLDFLSEDEWERMSAKEKRDLLALNTPSDFVFSFDQGTLEGFINQCQSVKLFGKGAAYVTMQEFGSYITGMENDTKKGFLTGLMKAFDVQEFGAKVIKGSRHRPTVRNIPVVFMGNTSGKWLKGGDQEEVLMRFVGGGLGRRSFIFYPRRFETQPEGETLLEVLEKRRENTKEVSEMVFDLRNEITNYYTSTPLNKEYRFDEGAKELVEIYTLYGELKFDQLVNEQESIASEHRGRAWKMTRLAGLFAWLNNPKGETISVQDVKEAIYFTEYFSNKTTQFIYEQEAQPHIKLLEFLKRNPGKILKTDLRKENFIPYRTYNWNKEFDELVKDAQVQALQEGYEIIQTTGPHNAQYTQLVKRTLTDPDRIPIMIAPAQNMTYEQIRVNTEYRLHITSWNKLHEVVKKYAYMPQLNNGHRSKKDALPGGVLLGLDVDANWSLASAKKFLKDNNIKSLIVTTASHQKSVSKDGKPIEPRDKFRILILLATPFTKDANAWKRIVTNVMKKFDGIPDEGCSDISRFFYPSPPDAKHYYIDGDPLDWIDWDFEEPKLPVVKMASLENVLQYVKQNYGIIRKGERDVVLNNIYFYLKESGVDIAEIGRIIREVNKKYLEEPFTESYLTKWEKDR